MAVQIGWKNFISAAGTLLVLANVSFNPLAPSPSYAQDTQNETVVFLGDNNYAPYEFIKDGKPAGANVDLLNAIGKVLGRPIEIRLMSWSEAQKQVQEGKGRALTFMSKNEERLKLYDFTEPTFAPTFSFFVKNENASSFDIKALSNKRIGVHPSGFPKAFLTKNHPEITYVLIEDDWDGFGKLLRGEVDAVATTEWVGYHTLKKHALSSISSIQPPFAQKIASIAVPKGNPDLVRQINQAIRELKQRGDFARIVDKWSGKKIILLEQWQVWNIAVVGVLIFILIVSTIVIAFTLRSRNKARLVAEILRDNNVKLESEITERKRAEKELQYHEERFRDFADSSSDWHWETDEYLRFTNISKGHRDSTEFEPTIFIGKQRQETTVENTNSEKWLQHLDDLEHRRPFRDFTFELKIPGGHRSVVRVNGKPVFDQNGAFLGYRGTSTEITERKALEEQLHQSQKLKAVGQLTGGIAHDFNNLLGVMIGNAEILRDLNGEDEKAKLNVEAILKAADRGASLTQRLLAFSRNQNLSPQPTSINGMVFGLEDMLHRTLGETIELHTHSGSETFEALIDPHQFENALINLSINARDAMPNGGVLTIEIANVTLDETYAEQNEEVTPGDYVKVTVSDTGTGMTPEVMEKVFEPFYTTKEIGEGSGLGLSMVYGFIKQSKGHVTIHSEVGHGTTIALYLPRSEEAVSNEKTKDETAEFVLGSERILVVEDDKDLREIPTSILRDQGYVVVEAKDGKQAIKLLKNDQPFDLLFTDVILPGGMNGVEIAAEAKRIQPNIKTLFTSGYSEDAVAHNGKLDPGVTLVNKPYRRAELLDKVQAILESADN